MKAQYKLYVIATGVKKRCRNTERHMLKAGYADIEGFNLQAAINKGLDLVKQEMKSTTKAYLSIDYVELSNERGFSVEEWQPFDDRHKKVMLFDNTQGNQEVSA